MEKFPLKGEVIVEAPKPSSVEDNLADELIALQKKVKFDKQSVDIVRKRNPALADSIANEVREGEKQIIELSAKLKTILTGKEAAKKPIGNRGPSYNPPRVEGALVRHVSRPVSNELLQGAVADLGANDKRGNRAQ